MRKRPIRVLYVAHNSNLTGASRSLLDLIAGLDRSAVAPHVLLPKHGPIEEKLRELEVPFYIRAYWGDVRSSSNIKNLIKLVLSPYCQERVNRFVEQGDFNLIHCNSILVDVGMIAARRLGMPYICHVRELVKEDHGKTFRNEKLIRDLISHASKTIFISHYVAQKFQDWVPEINRIIMFNGFSTKHYFTPQHVILESGETSILLAGRIHPGKGQLDAIRAIQVLRDMGLNVTLNVVGEVGDQDYYRTCYKYIIQHHLENLVRIYEFVDDLSDLRSMADISLMCSRSEAMGRVTIEGMLAGCLVIGADSGATPELIEDGVTGFLYESGNSNALAMRIVEALADKDGSRIIADRGRRWAKESFESTEYADKIVRLYKEVLNDGYGC